MVARKRRYRSYVQLFIPTRDRRSADLPAATTAEWRAHAEAVFRAHAAGYYVSPVYRIDGAFHSASGDWIDEANYAIKTFAPAANCRRLIRALEAELIPAMGVAMDQESIAVESSVEGLAIYDIETGDDDG